MQWDVWCVYVAALKERSSATTNEDHVAKEVWVDNDIKLLAKRTNVDCTDGAGLIVVSDGCTESSGELKDVGNFRSADDEVSATTKSLAVNLCRNIIDCLNEGLVPFGNGTSEVRSLGGCTNFAPVNVNKETWSTRPVACTSSCTVNEVSKDLTVNLKSDLLREDAC